MFEQSSFFLSIKRLSGVRNGLPKTIIYLKVREFKQVLYSKNLSSNKTYAWDPLDVVNLNTNLMVLYLIFYHS